MFGKKIIKNIQTRLQQFEKNVPQAPYIYFLIAYLCSILQMAAMKKVANEGIPTYQIQLFRSLTLFITIYNMMDQKTDSLDLYKDKKSHWVLMKVQFIEVFNTQAMFYGFSLMLISDANVLFMTMPIWVQIWSAILYKERISGTQIGYTLLSFIGIILIIRPPFITNTLTFLKDSNDQEQILKNPNKFIGAIFTLAAACGIGLAASFRKALQNKVSSFVIVMYLNITVIIVSPILMIFQEEYNLDIFITKNIVWMLLFVFVSFFKLVLEAKAQLLESPAKLSPLSYTTIFYALIIDVFVFDEVLSFYSLIGSIFVVFTSYKIIKLKK